MTAVIIQCLKELELESKKIGITEVDARYGTLPFAIESAMQIQKGDVVTSEFGARYLGYEGQTGRPKTMGAPTSESREIWEVVTKGASVLEATPRPGVTAEEIRLAGTR